LFVLLNIFAVAALFATIRIVPAQPPLPVAMEHGLPRPAPKPTLLGRAQSRVNAAIRHLLTADVWGPVNLVSPSPVTNKEFTKTLGKVLHRPTAPVAIPGFVLKAALGQFAEEGVLAGQRLAPVVLDTSGFEFTHPDLRSALGTVLATH